MSMTMGYEVWWLFLSCVYKHWQTHCSMESSQLKHVCTSNGFIFTVPHTCAMWHRTSWRVLFRPELLNFEQTAATGELTRIYSPGPLIQRWIDQYSWDQLIYFLNMYPEWLWGRQYGDHTLWTRGIIMEAQFCHILAVWPWASHFNCHVPQFPHL